MTTCRFAIAAMAALLLALPLTAQDGVGAGWEAENSDEDQQSAGDEGAFSILDTRLSEAFEIDIESQWQTRVDAFVGIGRDAQSARVANLDPDFTEGLAELEGIAWYYAAEAVGPDMGVGADAVREIDYLTAGLAAFHPILQAREYDSGPSYEYSRITSRLFEIGLATSDSRLAEWSAARVAAARFRVRIYPDNLGDVSLLAEALYDHGWMSGDKALIAEADALYPTIPEAQMSADLPFKREQVKAGKAPYTSAGSAAY